MRILMVLLILASSLCAQVFAQVLDHAPRKLSRQQLREDARQLATILESSHPDPYLHGGGRIAFHRRLQHVYQSIPEDGMTVEAFHRLLMPFMAALGDGHTSIYSPSVAQGAGLPIAWHVVEQELYVSAVFQEAHRPLLGARLKSLHGVPYQELVRRQRGLRGAENDYGHLDNLAYGLGERSHLLLLLPGWDGSQPLSLQLQDGTNRLHTLSISCQAAKGRRIEPPSRVPLPVLNSAQLGFGFLDQSSQVGLLRIRSCTKYREHFERFLGGNFNAVRKEAQEVYQAAHGKSAPKEDKALVEGLPAATTLFQDMMKRMQAARTQTLLVDLRGNGGGNDEISRILCYFLHGQAALPLLETGYAIPRLSERYFQRYPNKRTALCGVEEQYSFEKERQYQAGLTARNKDVDRERKAWESWYACSPEFLKVFRGERLGYQPANIRVITDEGTFSAAFTIALDLASLGAEVIGTPSGQAANCFIDILNFALAHSGLEGQFSYKLDLRFPEDLEKGKVLRPKRLLTYEDLKQNAFDPNTSVLLGMR